MPLSSQATTAARGLAATSASAAAGALARALRALAERLAAHLRRHPLRALLLSNLATLALALHAASRSSGGVRALLVRLLLRAARATPVVRGQLVRMKAQMRERIERMVVKDLGATTCALPADGLGEAELTGRLREWAAAEAAAWRAGTVSGTVFSGEEGLTRLMAEAGRLYALSDPAHPDVFPSVRKMEAEVVAMCAGLFHCEAARGGCGTMTSGGTESILLAAKAYRDHARASRGVLCPEMVLPSSAHAAFDKAAALLGIAAVRVPVHAQSFRADVQAMAAAVTRNTVLLVGSAPSYAQGVLDPIGELSELALAKGVGLHVDCGLGSLLLPLMGRLGRQLPLLDFRLPGVCSLSVGTHSYGFGPKGSAVLLYRTAELRCAQTQTRTHRAAAAPQRTGSGAAPRSHPRAPRRQHQYFVSTGWSGGIYATPTAAGSRPGCLIAGTWAVMLRLGQAGYLSAFRQILQAAQAIEDGVRETEGLALLGSVDTSIVCFGAAPTPSRRQPLSILAVGDAMSARGWSLNTLQHPPCLHICVTMPHTAPGVAQRFVDDLRAAVAEVAAAPAGAEEGNVAALYGMAGAVREASVIEEVACTFLDALYKV